ncbi:MAG TPA: transcription-repair coupling factor [Polyangia bacterium]|jgi:transcription-repair coupling factor (superfamily II helicase)
MELVEPISPAAAAEPVRAGLARIEAALAEGARCARVTAADPALVALVAARLAAGRPAGTRPLLCITADEEAAQALARDLTFFLGTGAPEGEDLPLAPPRVMFLPAVETSPYADLSPDRRAIMQRLAVLFRLSQGFAGDALVMSAAAWARRVVPRAGFADLCDVIQAEEELDRDATAALLDRSGYGRVPVVEDPGTFAVRGGVLDVFPPLYRYPARIELFGDLVESIRFFDPQTQRTMRSLKELYLHPVRETVRTRGSDPRPRVLAAADAAEHPSSRTRAILEQIEQGQDFFGVEGLAPAFHARMGSLAEYVPEGALWLVDDPEAVLEQVRRELVRDGEGCAHARADHRIAFPPEDFWLTEEEAAAALTAARRVETRRIRWHEPGAAAPDIVLAADNNAALSAEMHRARAERGEEILRPLALALREDGARGVRCVLVSPNLTHAERLAGLLRGHDLEPVLRRTAQNLDLLYLPGEQTADVRGAGGHRSSAASAAPGASTASDIVGEQRTGPPDVIEVRVGPLGRGFRLPADRLVVITEEEIFGPRVRRAQPRPKGDVFGDLSALEIGDHVVHADHGIGRYRGLTKLPVKGIPIDFLHLEYEGGTLYLPVYRLNLLQRYVGGDRPRLDKIGGLTWEKTQRKASAEVRQLAEELLQLYAQRQALPGHPFPGADPMFREFEATFPFEETEDQQRAIDDVLGDMEQGRAMDRLVCGDVGYGKTEVALRATLRAVQGGRQVAVLAPTTVLVEQHNVTFSERFRDYPVRVASLSRFKSKAEQIEVVKRLAEGQVDVVIGTHRLLSADVRFKDLGLLIIDEEQRFGVAHKERLKRLRTQVDVLTLTATPIPRTLHLAMVGLREISIIATPPADRLAIRTLLCRHDPSIIREGVRRELARGGQVFFVHNRVEDLELQARKIQEHVPEARIATAHGQMDERRLERVMVDFVDHKYDVLVCTTIIESGLDIASANTMFVNHADRFGLAQLYQIRGRIGRSRERAYCYLMVPAADSLTNEAKQRLAVLQRFTELGAGFNIASHDLEIRGAGELLGAKQSGTIAAVGFEMYTKLLEEAVAELRGESITRERDPDLTTDLPAYIPDDYVPDVGQRLDLYKRFSGAADEDEIAALLVEMADRFGTVPEAVTQLADLMVCKAHARRLHAATLELSETKVALALGDGTPLRPERVAKLVSGKRSPWKISPDMRLTRTLTEDERGGRLGAAKKILQELLACAE